VTALFLARQRARGASKLFERNAYVYRHIWAVLASGFFEPLFYLLSIGVGIGELVGDITLPGGRVVAYTSFVAPALLASSAMNGAIYDSTMNVFYKLKFAHVYDAVLATPLGPRDIALGEIAWALFRGQLYAIAFLVVMLAMGLVYSLWAVFALPAALLIGFAFAAAGMAATSHMRSWQDFEYVQLAILPLFLFSTTFYPLDTYPRAVQIVVECTPLYHGVSLMRDLCLGTVAAVDLVHVAYLVAMGLLGLRIAGRRIGRLLLT
jgi:lipooligosaccharide transport system permease protein